MGENIGQRGNPRVLCHRDFALCEIGCRKLKGTLALSLHNIRFTGRDELCSPAGSSPYGEFNLAHTETGAALMSGS